MTTTLLCLTKENHQPTPPVFDADEHGNADAGGEDRKRHDFHAGGPFWRHTNLERWISFGKTMVFDGENHGLTRKSVLTYPVFLGNMGCSTIFGKSTGKPWSSN